MAIISIDVRGLGDVNLTMPTITSQNAARQIAQLRNVARQSGLNLYERLNIMPQANTTTPAGGSFIDQWGMPIAAGLGAFTIGLVIAKLARKRKAA